MNWYFESFIDKLEKAQSKEQAKQIMDLCCEGKNPKGEKVARGCVHCVTCDETRCPVWRQYQLQLIMLDSQRYADPTPHTHIRHTRKYKITPKKQCQKTVSIQITKLLKKSGNDDVVLHEIQEHVNKGRFKRALNLANKNDLTTIANTIGVYISELAAKKCKNK